MALARNFVETRRWLPRVIVAVLFAISGTLSLCGEDKPGIAASDATHQLSAAYTIACGQKLGLTLVVVNNEVTYTIVAPAIRRDNTDD